MSAASTASDQEPVLSEDDLAVLTGISTTSAPANRVGEVDSSPLTDREVCEVIHEMRRPWEVHAAPPNFLNPHVIDIRRDGHNAVGLSDCPVCDGRYGQPTFAVCGLRHQLLTCTDCGLGRLHPLPTAEEIADFYPQEYYGSPGAKFEPLTEAAVRFVGTLHVKLLSRRLPQGSRILDIGCGRGVLLSALADYGHEVHGMDLSETAVHGADPRAEIRVAPCLTHVAYPARHFDQVILWHVLEHLRNPREVLREVHRILKPGGQVIVAVPNFSSLQARWAGPAWFHLDLPRHLFHFPVAGLRQLLTRTKFEVVREQHFSLRQNPFGWIQSAMNKSVRWPRNALYNLLHNYDADRGTSSLPTQLGLRCAYLAGMPLAAGLSAITAALRTGATVCVVGRAK